MLECINQLPSATSMKMELEVLIAKQVQLGLTCSGVG